MMMMMIIIIIDVCKETGVQMDKKHWYEHLPKSVETSQGNHIVE